MSQAKKLLVASALWFSLIPAEAFAGTLGSGGQEITFQGVGISYRWTLTEYPNSTSLDFAYAVAGAKYAATWNPTNGGCKQLIPKHPVTAAVPIPGALDLRVDACSSSVVCEGGRQRLRIEASFWLSGIINSEYRAIHDNFYPNIASPKC